MQTHREAGDRLLGLLLARGIALGVLLGPSLASTAAAVDRDGYAYNVAGHAISATHSDPPEAGGLRVFARAGPRESALQQRLAVDLVAPNSAARFVVAADGTTVDLVGGATRSSGKGDPTAAGHALSKHGTGQRAGSSAFPALSGDQQNWNRIAAEQLDDILTTGHMVQRTHPNHGPIIEVFAPDGRGARWYADGGFFGFLEP